MNTTTNKIPDVIMEIICNTPEWNLAPEPASRFCAELGGKVDKSNTTFSTI